MQMNVSITPELHEVIQKKVASGLYSNASEVVRDSIRRMDEADQQKAAWLKLNHMLTAPTATEPSGLTVEDVVNNVLK